jgi:uncharacterized protein
MSKLGTAITEAIVHDYGASAFLSRLSDPFWFHALGSVMGAVIAHENAISPSLDGRSLFDDKRRRRDSGRQLSLF